ncbi:MAG: heme ABC transporter ATP-binding protein [Desulfobacterales bacterium]|nr:heme ABC transporter ATP-binding protein [Desulfobacterales bacterium]
MNFAVDIDHVTFGYEQQRVIEAVSITVPMGIFFIVIGPNGSGKTTLLKMIAGTLKMVSGRINILGHPIQTYRRKLLAQNIAVVPQTASLDFPFTVEEFVAMGRSPHLGLLGLASEADAAIVHRAMQFAQIDNLAGRTLQQLSGGEQQRVLIARAICQEPRIILLDEPTSSLDPAHQIQIMEFMEKYRGDRDVTIIMVSHNLNLASMYADHIVLLKQGKVVQEGKPVDVLTAENLKQAYGCAMLVDQNPISDRPRVTVVPDRLVKKS